MTAADAITALNSATSIALPMATLRVGRDGAWGIDPTYSIPRTRFASSQGHYRIGTLEDALAAYASYSAEIPRG